MISNPDVVMDTYSLVVTCEINPTSTVDYCEVFAGNTDTTLTGKFTMYVHRNMRTYCTYTYIYCAYMHVYMQTHSCVCLYIYVYVCI